MIDPSGTCGSCGEARRLSEMHSGNTSGSCAGTTCRRLTRPGEEPLLVRPTPPGWVSNGKMTPPGNRRDSSPMLKFPGSPPKGSGRCSAGSSSRPRNRLSPSGEAKTIKNQSVLIDVNVGLLSGEQAIVNKDGARFYRRGERGLVAR